MSGRLRCVHVYVFTNTGVCAMCISAVYIGHAYAKLPHSGFPRFTLLSTSGVFFNIVLA